jgi:MFS family permease
LLSYVKKHKFVAPSFRLICLCDALCGLLYLNFYLFCLQNVQLTNEDAVKVFLTIACGFFCGALLALWSKRPAKQTIKFFLLESLIVYVLFCLAGSHELLPTFSFLAGLSGACIFLPANSQAQKLVPRQLRGRMMGARISVSTAILLASALSAEQLAMRYSGLTLMKILSLESAVLCILVILFRNQVSRHLNKSGYLKIRVI